MIRSDVINNLLVTYAKHGITKEVLESAMDDGLKNYDMSLEGVYNGLRMSLAHVFHEEEHFSIDDVMSITGESREEVTARVEQMLNEVKASGGDPDDYATKIDRDKVQRFILPPGFMN